MSILLDDDARGILDHYIARSISVAEAAEKMAVALSVLLDQADVRDARMTRVVSAGYVRMKPSLPADPPQASVEPL